MIIDAKGIHYRELNRLIREILTDNSRLTLDNVNGQRYIGTGLDSSAEIIINGTPGNDLAMFMDGPGIAVHGNAQDGVANTMNAGEVVVHGSCGDVTGMGCEAAVSSSGAVSGTGLGFMRRRIMNTRP